MKYYFIINPESGRFANDKEGFIERIDKACRLRDIKYEIHYTDGFGKARKVAESIPNDEECIVFSVGGDGNLNEIINGVVKKHMVLYRQEVEMIFTEHCLHLEKANTDVT